MVQIGIIGIVVFGIVAAMAFGTMIAMFVCSRKVIKDQSSSDDLKNMFPEVSASKDDNKDI